MISWTIENALEQRIASKKPDLLVPNLEMSSLLQVQTRSGSGGLWEKHIREDMLNPTRGRLLAKG